MKQFMPAATEKKTESHDEAKLIVPFGDFG